MKKGNILKFAVIAILVGVIGILFTFKSYHEGKEIKEEKVFAADEVQQIVSSIDNAKVEVLPTNDSQIKVKLSGKLRKDRDYMFSAKVKNNTLSIKSKVEKFQLVTLDFFPRTVHLKIYVPNKEYQSLEVSTTNGKTELKNLNIKKVKVKMVDGVINLQNIQSNEVDVSNKDGAILLDQVDGAIKGKMVSGKIEMNIDDLERSIQLEGMDGKITVNTKKEPENVKIEAKTMDGKVDLFGNDTNALVTGNGQHTMKLKLITGAIIVKK